MVMRYMIRLSLAIEVGGCVKTVADTDVAAIDIKADVNEVVGMDDGVAAKCAFVLVFDDGYAVSGTNSG